MSKRRNSGKLTSQQSGKPVKITLGLPADLAIRFTVHAGMAGLSKSELFADLVKAGCRRFVVHDLARTAAAPAESDAA